MFICLILMGQSIDIIFENRVCWRILKFFLNNPTGEFYEKEIQQKIGAARASVSKWLRALENLELIHVVRRGRLKLHGLNRENPVVKQLKILETISRLLPRFKDFKGEGELYLYGSTSRGEDIEGSDIDILVIGRDRGIIEKIRRVDDRIKVSFFTPLEWARMARDDQAFYERVEKDRIRLM
jgi:predicted nucleotidyltransferase